MGLALLGAVAILGGTFGAGVFVGRYWARVQVTVGLVKPRAETDVATTGRSATGSAAVRRHVPALTPVPSVGTAEPEKRPSLTFYEELTAPLERPARGARGEATPPAAPPPAAAAGPAPTATPSSPSPPVTPSAPRGEPVRLAAVERSQPRAESLGRRGAEAFTVQVGAYGSRAAAESLRATLVAHGFAAGVTTVDTPAGMRYRVRVGTFPTREAATAVVSRLTAEAKIGAIVMPAGGTPTR